MRSLTLAVAAVAFCCSLSIGPTAVAASPGDANGDGKTSVADGVLALRAASGLASSCELEACDVDASGTITVTDGVTVLRNVAGIPATPAVTAGPRLAPSAVAVHFVFSATAELQGYQVDITYPLAKGGFLGSADGVACTAGGDAIFVANDRDDGTLALIEANATPMTFPREVTCLFEKNAGETLFASDLGFSVVEVVENSAPGDPADLQLAIQVDDEPPTPCKDDAWRFTTAPGGALDIGWTGLGHGTPLPSQTRANVPLDCSAGDEACAVTADALVGQAAGAPIPISAGGVSQCVVPYYTSAPTGTVDCTNGCASVKLDLQANTFLTLHSTNPCPPCIGDPVPGDGVQGGLCFEGATPGAPCDVHGITSRFDLAGPDFGHTSLDCLPTGSAVGQLPLHLEPLHTGTTTVEAGVDCLSPAFPPGSCYCEKQVQPNSCIPDGVCGESGFCEEGPLDGVCDREPFFYCQPGTGTRDCDDIFPGAGSCIEVPRACFGTSITRTGSCGTDQATLVSVFCVPPTQAAAINTTLGLPGPAAVTQPIAFGPVPLPSIAPPSPSPGPTPQAPTACTLAPRGDCHTLVRPHEASLTIRDKAHGTDELAWRFLGGTETGIFEFGNPFFQTSFALCVYDANGAVFQSQTSPFDVCRRSQSCWRGNDKGAYFYTNQFGNTDGVIRVELTPGLSGAARVTFKARGKRIALPTLPLAAPLTVQLQGSDASCWTATYAPEDLVKNTPTNVRAVTQP